MEGATKGNSLKMDVIFGNDPLKIEIKKVKDVDLPQKIQKGDWIDLRAAEDVRLNEGEFALIPLGVAMKLPDGYEAHVVPRSSTFKKYGIIQTNHHGVIDNTYCGNEDEWMMPVFALRKSYIKKNERICQFRIMEVMPPVEFVEMDDLNAENRGGFGTTGVN